MTQTMSEKNCQFQIPRCYDSHAHIHGTGVFLEGLDLTKLRSLKDIRSLSIEKKYFKGDWLVGFGWNQFNWNDEEQSHEETLNNKNYWPNRLDLDRYFPDFPVAFTRIDGHSLWVNTIGLRVLGLLPEIETGNNSIKNEKKKISDINSLDIIFRDERGVPTGILQETAKIAADFFIPDFTREQKKLQMEAALDYFYKRGFTHLREMTGNREVVEVSQEILKNRIHRQYIEFNLVCENVEDLKRVKEDLRYLRSFLSKDIPIRILGVKIFLDGSLGSEGAFLSQNYSNSNLSESGKGVLLWGEQDFKKVVEEVWQEGYEVAVHAIGDEAAHLATLWCYDINEKNKINGRFNLEHAQVLRKDTIEVLKKLNSVCHMQPCHYLSDHSWLFDKLGVLSPYAFQWNQILTNGISLQFGSDSPIESPSVIKNMFALVKAHEAGIKLPPVESSNKLSIQVKIFEFCESFSFEKEWLKFHSHPDPTWGGECTTDFICNQTEKISIRRNL